MSKAFRQMGAGSGMGRLSNSVCGGYLGEPVTTISSEFFNCKEYLA
jgi:hypothetical protein